MHIKRIAHGNPKLQQHSRGLLPFFLLIDKPHAVQILSQCISTTSSPHLLTTTATQGILYSRVGRQSSSISVPSAVSLHSIQFTNHPDGLRGHLQLQHLQPFMVKGPSCGNCRRPLNIPITLPVTRVPKHLKSPKRPTTPLML
jgi:hypothetical protein